jgi:hypothetical protein
MHIRFFLSISEPIGNPASLRLLMEFHHWAGTVNEGILSTMEIFILLLYYTVEFREILGDCNPSHSGNSETFDRQAPISICEDITDNGM